MKITILPIGDELLIGQVTDTNSGFLARTVQNCGWSVETIKIIHDEPDSIKKAVVKALDESDIVVTSGGLGPTKDDLTKAALMDIFGGVLKRDNATLERIKEYFHRRGLKLNSLTEDQALVPTSCLVIPNRFGTAPVMWFEKNGKILVSLPGVPSEFQGAWIEEVLPRLKDRFKFNTFICHKVAIMTDITESDLAIKLERYEEELPDGLHLAYLPHSPYIRLRLDGISEDPQFLEQLMTREYEKLLTLLGNHVLSYEDLTPAQILLKLLENKNLKISVAESCTGGNISSLLTSIPGSSRTYNGGVVAYSNQVKINVLGVKEKDIEEKGAVSLEVVEQMAYGISKICETECAIATSGIAGPSGGSKEKPVGTVCIAVLTPKGIESKRFFFAGNRDRVIERASLTSLIWICKILGDKEC